MTKSHCTYTCIKSSKEFVVCKTKQECISVSYYEDLRYKKIKYTYNHIYLMGTITFEVHPINPHLLKTSAFVFFAYFLFEHIMHKHIRERRNTQLCKPKHHNFAMPKHTDVIHDWQVLVVRWLFMPFS